MSAAPRGIPDQVEKWVTQHLDCGEPVRASVTFLGSEPISIARFQDVDRVHYLSLGCSAHPMGDPMAMVVDESGPRAEVIVTLKEGVDALAKTLAVVAAAPAVEGLILGEDILVDLQNPLWPGSAFTAVILGEPTIPDLEIDPAPVRIFQATPITMTEAAWVRLKGVPALREAWLEANVDVTNPNRPAVSVG